MRPKAERGRRIELKPKKARVVGIFSAKGGVGKTTTTVNTATFLASQMDGNVLAADLNLPAPNLALHFSTLNPPITIHDVLGGEASIEESIQDCGDGVHIIPGSIGFDEAVHLVDLREYINPLRRRYEVIILDTSPGFGPEVISAVKVCDEILIVTNPEIPTIASTFRTFQTADQYKVPIGGIVLNKVLDEYYEPTVSEISERLSWPVVSVVPWDGRVRESLSKGTPLARFDPDAPAANQFKKLAKWELDRLSRRT